MELILCVGNFLLRGDTVNIRKRFSAIVLFFVLFMASQPVAFAVATQPSSLQKIDVEEHNTAGLEEFRNYIGKFFNNPKECTLYDKSGNDISDEFHEKYDNLFEKGDFSVLQEISESTISYMSYRPLPDSIDNISSTISRANKRYTYGLYAAGILIEGVMDFEIQMTPRPAYYVDSSGKIVQPVNGPILDTATHDFVVCDFSFRNTEVWSYISVDSKMVYFDGEFCVYRVLEGTAFYSGKMKVETAAHTDSTLEKPIWEQTGTYLEPPF